MGREILERNMTEGNSPEVLEFQSLDSVLNTQNQDISKREVERLGLIHDTVRIPMLHIIRVSKSGVLKMLKCLSIPPLPPRCNGRLPEKGQRTCTTMASEGEM